MPRLRAARASPAANEGAALAMALPISAGGRRLAHGLVAGLLLSCLRAPLGLDWTQLAVIQGTTAALFRAAALLAIALSLDPARPAWRTGVGAGWLAAVWAGHALHGLALDVAPTSRAGYALLLLVGTGLLRGLAGKRGAADPTRADGAGEPLARSERLGLVLVGLGVALALETLAHQTRLFTMATQADDTLVGSVWLLLLTLAAGAFGPLLAKLGSERARFAPGLALGAASSVAGLVFLAPLGAAGLHGYLGRLDLSLGWLRALDGKLGGFLGLHGLPPLDGASIGTLWTTALLAAAALVVPAFVLGATLGASRSVARLAHTLVGAALGLVVLPSLIRAHGQALDLEQARHAAFAWELIVAGTTLAAAGSAAQALGLARGRLVGLALALAVALVPWIRPHFVQWSFSPWSPTPIAPELVWPTAEGLLTVERARDGRRVLTLDRKRLTPTWSEEGADGRRLRAAWALLPEERRTGARVLFVGQITPERMRVLRTLGVPAPDRTAPWHAAMQVVEELLFRDEEPPGGAIVAPGEARARLADGEYDWVVAPAIHGPIVTWKSEAFELWGSVDAPRLTDLELGGDALGVAWLEADSRAPRGLELEPLILDLERLDSLALGLVRGPAREARAELGPRLRAEARAGPSPFDFLWIMPQLRKFRLESAWSASLDPAAAPELVRGLALHFGAQQLSAPGESRAQQVELDEEVLRALFAAVPPPGELDSLSRELWESLARMLVEKREPEHLIVYVEPVAERFAPWPELDRAVARAYQEVLEPDAALRFLERARTARPNDIDLLLESAQCAEELGDGPAAIEFLEQALALQPGRADLERALGLTLLRAGDERGREFLERARASYPQDPELLQALGLPEPAERDG